MQYRRLVQLFASVACAALLVACGPTGRATGDKSPDGGGGVKNDPNRDDDGDGFTENQGDCNDADLTTYPNANDVCDGRDNDCSGHADDTCDNDKDGKSFADGDCNDTDTLVGPDAMEVGGDNVDNNCDGQIDEQLAPCQVGGKNDPKSFASSFELCGPWVVQATLNKSADARGYNIKNKLGKYTPKAGSNFTVFSTGLALESVDPGFVKPQPGTAYSNQEPNPLPMNNNNQCYSGKDPTTVNDYIELKLTLKVPTNAKSFSFQFNFLSAEYPEFVGTMFNDKFLAILDSQSFKGNISFDKNMNPITVNVGFFDVCDSASICGGKLMNNCGKPSSDLAGTGHDGGTGGGTGWLTTTAPVTPGETATLRFIIFDEGDHIYDSTVVIDNFQWQVQETGGPITIG